MASWDNFLANSISDYLYPVVSVLKLLGIPDIASGFFSQKIEGLGFLSSVRSIFASLISSKIFILFSLSLYTSFKKIVVHDWFMIPLIVISLCLFKNPLILFLRDLRWSNSVTMCYYYIIVMPFLGKGFLPSNRLEGDYRIINNLANKSGDAMLCRQCLEPPRYTYNVRMGVASNAGFLHI